MYWKLFSPDRRVLIYKIYKSLKSFSNNKSKSQANFHAVSLDILDVSVKGDNMTAFFLFHIFYVLHISQDRTILNHQENHMQLTSACVTQPDSISDTP